MFIWVGRSRVPSIMVAILITLFRVLATRLKTTHEPLQGLVDRVVGCCSVGVLPSFAGACLRASVVAGVAASAFYASSSMVMDTGAEGLRL